MKHRRDREPPDPALDLVGYVYAAHLPILLVVGGALLVASGQRVGWASVDIGVLYLLWLVSHYLRTRREEREMKETIRHSREARWARRRARRHGSA